MGSNAGGKQVNLSPTIGNGKGPLSESFWPGKMPDQCHRNQSRWEMKLRTQALMTCLPLFFTGILSAPTRAQDESRDAAQIRLWHAFYRQRAMDFSLEEKGDSATSLTLVREPIQTWTNPIRGDTQHGTVHLWTNAGRPSVIGSVWSALDAKDRSRRNICYEFHSLSQAPVSARLADKTWWSPQEPGVDWLPLADVPQPGPSRAVRLRKMRDLAHELRGQIVGRDGGPDTELRLLPQPLYRYPEETAGVIDGAVFAFTMATDPELIVVVELRRDETSGKPSWMLAPARFTGDSLRLSRGERTLWESPQWEYRRDRIYDFLYGVEQQQDIRSEKDDGGRTKGRE
jgi:hypothetical protein